MQRVVAAWFALVAALWSTGVLAQPLTGGADEVKAAYLYRFLAYVDWPDAAFASPNAPIVIGVVGSDAVAAELARVLVGRTAHGRPVAARRLASGDAFDDVHVLYAGDAALLRSAWLQRARERPLLLVADGFQALDAGACIAFVLVDDRLRFDASLRAIDRTGLRVSSRLLALAQRVVGAP
ncbi:MAG TPA: YfiR family protein [Caldimonas sp.]|nr:YfiR family protein [Caldimonas sp.]